MKYVFLFLGIAISSHAVAQITLIPDEEFEMFLVFNGIDTDFTINGQVNTADIENLIELNIFNVPISDLTGIEDFAALEILICTSTDLVSLDVSQNQNLRELSCNDNKLTQLILDNNLALEFISCGNPSFDAGGANAFTSLDFSEAPNLKVLDTQIISELTAINLNNNTFLEELYAPYCELNTLDLSNNVNLKTLDLGGVEVSDFIFGVSNNLDELDVSNNPNLESVRVQLTEINSLNLQNGNNAALINMFADLNPDLMCIQVDDEIAANNGDAPYGSWNVDAQATYSEECILGLEENELEIFELYPNPASQLVRISSSSNLFPKEIQIYSITGQLMMQPTFNSSSIDVSKLASGLYILKAQFDEGFSSRTFVKE
jgi:hypothetical protein